MAKRNWPRSSLKEIFNNWITYRNLEPLCNGDATTGHIPGLREIWSQVGLTSYYIPRKAKDEAYMRVILYFLERAQELRGCPPLANLIYLGNRQKRDQATIAHLAKNTSLPLVTFLCEENIKQERQVTVQGRNMLANRWEAVVDLANLLREERFQPDERMAVIVDMDKTIIGARGRNAEAINKARVEGVFLTVKDLLGDRFEEARFRAIYGEMNQPKYHFFTEDNQDYVTYISLMASALVYPIHDIIEDLAHGQLTDFAQFVRVTGERLARSPIQGLEEVHQEVAWHLSYGDPTVFKSFRSKQFESTLARIDFLPDDTDEETLLAEEITITREVLDFVRFLKERGALPFLISDRPDESLIPDENLARQGYRPIHQVPMKVTGKPVYDRLALTFPR